MTSLPRTIVLLGLLAAVLNSPLRGQGCCTVGASSLGGLESGVLAEGSLSLSLGYQSSILTSAYRGTEKIEDPLHRTADVRYLTFQLEYALLSRVSVLTAISYSDKSRELTVKTGSGSSTAERTASFRGTGVGDLLVLVKYSLLKPTIVQATGIALGLGANLPTGSFTQEQNGSQLSIDLQPGTGAPALLGWMLISHALPETGLQFFLTSTYKYAGTNFDGYRIGDEIIATVLAEKSVSENYALFLAVRSRFAGKDFASRRSLIGTGGTYHDLMPGIGYGDGPSSLRLYGQLPLYRNVRGIQTTLTYMVGLQFAYRFE